MEFPAREGAKEVVDGTENSKVEEDKGFFGCAGEPEESARIQPKDGPTGQKPGDVRNGDLVSLLLAATPPYLYNIPLVPQTFFFSEMLKSFVQAKTDRQNLKTHQTHHRRQRKRSWREATPPKAMFQEARDKPLELTTPKALEAMPRAAEKLSKKCPVDGSERKYPEFGNSNFSVEKLANSSITSETDGSPANVASGDMLPPAPPLWYPLLYPPHSPYGIDPLHFFIDLRVSAHFWDRKLATSKLIEETPPPPPPLDLHVGSGVPAPGPSNSFLGRSPRNSAFRVPSPTRPGDASFPKDRRTTSRSVHYVISSLKDIYRALEDRADEEKKRKESKGKRKCKDLRALIGLELVVDYVKQESDGEEDRSDGEAPEGERSERGEEPAGERGRRGAGETTPPPSSLLFPPRPSYQ